MSKKVVIIGGGVAGIQTAITLHELGINPVIIEKEPVLGGKLNQWDRLFPSMTPAGEVLNPLLDKLKQTSATVMTSKTVQNINPEATCVELNDGEKIACDAIVVATGFDVFDANIKEEYGYGLYDNVVTTVDLERMFKDGKLVTSKGVAPKKIAFLHCVGSRDEKVNQKHCSRVCCITGVKQAIEIKQALPESDVYSFYMDMRMFGPGYEEMYRQAQEEYNIHFVRGRISEASQTIDGRVQIKAEDTLVARPLKMTVDMLVLIVGMKSGCSNSDFAQCGKVDLYPSGFIKPKDVFLRNVCSDSDKLFYAGTVTAPKNIGESINEGITAAHKVAQSLK